MEQHDSRSVCRFLSGFLVFFLASTQISQAIQIEVADSPETNLSLALTAIQSAKKSLVINAYELNSPQISDAIINQIKNSVTVSLLLEGQPVGGMGKAGVTTKDEIVSEMNRSSLPHKFLVMSSNNPEGRTERRFHYDHAKYIIVDGESLLVGSENYSVTGHPAEGTKGTRGWETYIYDRELASNFLRIFKNDSSTEHGDVFQISESRFNSPIPYLGQWTEDLSALTHKRPEMNYRSVTQPKTFDVSNISQLTSPNTSLSGLLNFIKNSKTTLDLELMSFSYRWGNTGNVSPLFEAVVNAAKRGVQVRVLLNDESAFGGGNNARPQSESNKKSGNLLTIQQFKSAAEKGNLKLEAEIADLKAMGVKYIHNKGALADGDKVLVSSINWNRNSLENNREAAVVIDSEDVYHFYNELFESDWDASRSKK